MKPLKYQKRIFYHGFFGLKENVMYCCGPAFIIENNTQDVRSFT